MQEHTEGAPPFAFASNLISAGMDQQPAHEPEIPPHAGKECEEDDELTATTTTTTTGSPLADRSGGDHAADSNDPAPCKTLPPCGIASVPAPTMPTAAAATAVAVTGPSSLLPAPPNLHVLLNAFAAPPPPPVAAAAGMIPVMPPTARLPGRPASSSSGIHLDKYASTTVLGDTTVITQVGLSGYHARDLVGGVPASMRYWR